MYLKFRLNKLRTEQLDTRFLIP